MAVVVDASAVGAIAFGEPEGATLSAHIEGESLLAPVLLDAELANLALKKVGRHRDRAAEMLLAFKAALALPITRVPVPALEAFALAAETGLTAYDASYLWVARACDAELVTLDRLLARQARDRGPR